MNNIRFFLIGVLLFGGVLLQTYPVITISRTRVSAIFAWTFALPGQWIWSSP